jgi:hypothetical protein
MTARPPTQRSADPSVILFAASEADRYTWKNNFVILCQLELTKQADTDNHIVLVGPGVRNPTLAKDKCRSVTAEFSPRTRIDHPNFTRLRLDRLIDSSWKASPGIL